MFGVLVGVLRSVWYVVSLRCEEADRIACVEACAVEGELGLRERVGAWCHRVLCRSCREARRRVMALDTALREEGLREGGAGGVGGMAGMGGEMPAEARARLRAALGDAEERAA